MQPHPLLEVCAFTFQSCLIAEKAGAARVEVCANPIEGGTTPSYGVLKAIRDSVSIAVYPIIRPRSGNYYYDRHELDSIRHDILVCRELHCDGISVGVQTIDGEIDTDALQRIVDWAGPLGVTCNRVFDNTPDPFKALEDVIRCGCERILTSGQAATAPEGAALLAKLVKKAGDSISIMPGAGIRSTNIKALISATGAKEYHASARVKAGNPVRFLNEAVSDYGDTYIADEVEVERLVRVMKEG